MAFEWAQFIDRHRGEIINEWVHRLHTGVNRQYSERPVEELYGTVTQALEACCLAIIHKDYSRINVFIGDISRMRIACGFSAHDVLKAFELFRTVTLPKLHQETSRDELYQCVVEINECLTYTEHCFINFFDDLHRQQMMEYMRRLEVDVKNKASELLESELRYKTLIEEINDGYVILQDEAIVFVNPAFCDMHEYPPEEMRGKRFDEFVDQRDRRRVAAWYRDHQKKDHGSSPLEYHRLTRSGKALPAEITFKSICYGPAGRVVGICRDITERVAMAEKVRESERMADIGRITTSLSHEIRNPLSSVKMNLQLLTRNLSIQGNDRRRLDISLREMQRLESVLEQLLDFAKPLRLKRSAFNLNRLLPSCIELLESRFEEHHLSVHLRLDPAMPEIFADSNKLERAIVNLLLNAVEASEPRTPIRVITQSYATASPPMVDFCIVNQGNIPDEVLPEIFKPFFTTKLKGTGLGLTNVKRVVKAHGGVVTVEKKNRGEILFRVRLPLGENHG